MTTVNKFGAARLLDPANAELSGQSRVNAEIFTAVEILGRKLERVEAERDRLARRLALIESSATVDQKTGKLYLPALVDAAPLPRAEYAMPRWPAAVSLMSGAVALFALSLVLFREPPPMLTKEQLAALDSLKGAQFALLSPESKTWKNLEAEPQENAGAADAAGAPVVAQLPDAVELTRQEQQAVPPAPVEVPVMAVVPPAGANNNVAGKAPAVSVTADEVKTATNLPVPLVRPEEVFIPGEDKIAEVPTQKTGEMAAIAPAAGEADVAPGTALPQKLADLEKRAYQGVPEAQHDLATLYASGRLVAQDYPRAIYWFNKAADGGVANAHYNLGVIHHQGLGAKADMRKAMAWYEKAAELGHPEAMYNLGISYIEGIGVKTDITKGIAYFKRAARAGVTQAAYNLGILYESNFVGTIDTAKAAEWYQMAADQGHTEARVALNRLKNVVAGDQALTLADMVEPAAGEEYGEGDSSPASEVPPASIQARGDILVRLQRVLIRQGLLPGPADGTMTPQTADAIRVYQKKLGLPEDGQPSLQLLDRVLQADSGNR